MDLRLSRTLWRVPRQPSSTPYEMYPVNDEIRRRIGTSRQAQIAKSWEMGEDAWKPADEQRNDEANRATAATTPQFYQSLYGLDAVPENEPYSPSGWSDNQDTCRDSSHELVYRSNEHENADPENWPLLPKFEEQPKDEVLEDSEVLPIRRGYMDRSSPFALDKSTGELSFMEWYPPGEGTITYLNDSGDVESLPNVSPWVFEERCPLLAQAFEPSRNGPKLFLEALSATTAKPFLRFLYTGSYARPGPDGDMFEDVPTSVLLHCQLYRLGDIYDLPELKQQAYVNVTRQCEFGCSSPDIPIDLCAAINFVYEHLAEHTNLIETIICYCVTCFLRHRLAEDSEFAPIAYSLRPFHQDLAKEIMKRGFEDDTAAAIIQMPYEPYVPETYASREDKDCVSYFHGDYDSESPSKKRKRPEVVPLGPGLSTISLALRQKREEELSAAEQTESEEEVDLYVPCKRRLSIVPDTKGKSPVYTSDSEYEVVAGPAVVQALSSDSESDTDTAVIDRPDPAKSQTMVLPVRRRNSSFVLVEGKAPVEVDSGSESDWALL